MIARTGDSDWKTLTAHFVLSLLFSVSALVIISSVATLDMFAKLCLFMFLLGSVFSWVTSSVD